MLQHLRVCIAAGVTACTCAQKGRLVALHFSYQVQQRQTASLQLSSQQAPELYIEISSIPICADGTSCRLVSTLHLTLTVTALVWL